MQLLEFPHCCTAKLIVDFGESDVAEGGDREVTYGEVRNYVQGQVQSFYNRQLAMIVATTNSQQTVANKVLEDLGFKHTKWMSKRQHPETRVRLWWKEIE
jgi:hypothetical protein